MADNFAVKLIGIFILSYFLKSHMINGKEQAPCLFFFGDSFFDNGNNNYIATEAKSNYFPYGIDYRGRVATGRHTNGKNMADFIAESLGFANPIISYSDTNITNIIKGVNYASAGAGIFEESGSAMGYQMSLIDQLLNHKMIIRSLLLLRGFVQAPQLLNKCVYVVNIGSDDYINNYLLPQAYPLSLFYTPGEFAKRLIQDLSQKLETLYNDGARKVAIFGLGQVGCIPQILGRYQANASDCVDFANDYVQLFNVRLKRLVIEFNNDLAGAKFTYINSVGIPRGDLLGLGITVFNSPCCVVSKGGMCIRNQTPCSNRQQHIFFDNFHPTEVIHRETAKRAYEASGPDDAYPYGIQQLAQL